MGSTSWRSNDSNASSLDEVRSTQDSIILDFKKSDHQQMRFKKNTDRQLAGFSKSAYQKLWYKSHTTNLQIDHTTKETLLNGGPKEDQCDSIPLEQLDIIQKGLSAFYVPPNEILPQVCDFCKGFRHVEKHSVDRVILPVPWTEHHLDDTNDTYYYNPDSGQIRWTPPVGTSAVNLLVFKETKSVYTVCRCTPSHEKRLQLLRKLKDHAKKTIGTRKETQTNRLNGALHALVLNITSK